jgi:hypothetical protein
VPEASDCASFVAESSPWCVLRTRPKRERHAIAALDALGVAGWAPELRKCVHWRGHQRLITRPLFPGYIFAQVDAHGEAREEVRIPAHGRRRKVSWDEIRRHIASLRSSPFMLVGGGGRAATIKQEIIDKLRELARELNRDKKGRAQREETARARIMSIFGDLVRIADEGDHPVVAFLVSILGREVKALR